jgi:CubicO group peptidase (beta-lactamase class C family)
MSARRLFLVLALALIIAGSVCAGVLIADWPFWKRVFALAQLPDGSEWPESFYQPVARVQGEARPFFPAAEPGERTVPDAALEEAAAFAQRDDSVALIVLHRGHVQLERYWQGMQPDALFSGRAMSRSLLGLAFGFAVADGRLALDEPVDKYLDEWRDEARGAITIRELLQDVSGLEEAPPQARATGPGAGPLARMEAAWNNYLGKNARLALGTDFAAAALSFGLVHEPGTRFALSNANAQLAGLVLERATGVAWERYFEQRVWRPIGAGTGEFYLDRVQGMPAMYCCFRATPRDFVRLGALLLDDGKVEGRQVLPPGWVAQMATTSRVNPLYGLQVWSGRARTGLREYVPGSGRGVQHGTDFLADDVIWMEGGGGRTVWAIPSRELVIVRLGRAPEPGDGSAIPNAILRGLQP